ncbi:MAG: OmpA family protein, partial [Planctomycetes bacterium]|nr:OmpA family protein [Planctomycetota bacterium]
MGENPDDISFYSFNDGSYLIRVQDQVLFDSGSAEINEAGRKALIDVCTQINGNPHGRIWVRGHTDNDPVKRPATLAKFPHGNLQLSAARAVEVAMVMITDGEIGADDISVMGFGEHMPLKENNSADNKRYNRRVEIYVSSGE